MRRLLLRVIPLVLTACCIGVHVGLAQVSVSLPAVNGPVGGSGLIALSVGDLTGQSVVAFEFTISYDPSVIEITGVSSTGTLTEGKLLLENTSVAGELSVSNASEAAYAGSGTLLNLEINYLAEGVSLLEFSNFSFNENNPVATTTNGSVTVGEAVVADTVEVALPTELLGVVNDSISIPISVGNISGSNIQGYEFTFEYDSGAIDVHRAKIANTISGQGVVSTSSSVPGAFTVNWSGTQALSGSGVLIELVATPLTAGSSVIDLAGFTFNSGSPLAETTGGVITATQIGNGAIPVFIPEVTAVVGQGSLVPVSVGDLTDEGVTSFEMKVTYDPDIIRVDGISQENSLTEGITPTLNLNNPGEMIVSWASVSPLEGDGALFQIRFSPLQTGVSSLLFENFKFNEGMPEVLLSSGSVNVSGGTSGINISLPKGVSGASGNQLMIPVTTSDLTGQNITSFIFSVSFDDSIVHLSDLSTSGTLMDGRTVNLDTSSPGQVIVSYSGANMVTSSGVLVNLVATLESPGESTLSFTSFRFNNGAPEVNTVNGDLSVEGRVSHVQLVHNSSDAPSVDIYINDEKKVDALEYGGATPFLNVQTTVTKIDVVNDQDVDNSTPVATATVSLENGKDYIGVINGLFAGSGKQAISLVVQESQQEAGSDNTVGLVIFQGSPDAPPLNAYIVDDSQGNSRISTLASELSFGESLLTAEFEPGVYDIEIAQDGGPRVGIYRADLTRTGGASLLFMVQGFLNPLLGQPDLSLTAYAPDGQAVLLPVSVNNEEHSGLPNTFQLQGNYPNPFNPTTTIQFDLPEPALVQIEIFDLVGRRVLSIPQQQFYAGRDQAASLDASNLASGTYIYKLTALSSQNTYVQSRTMTLLK